MKLFPHLALVSAIAISGNAMAMDALDDESLGASTGQEGITIAIKPPVSMFDAAPTGGPFAATGGMAGVIAINKLYIHDKDGVNDAAIMPIVASRAGAIVLDGLKIAGNGAIVVKIDADRNGGAPLLNVNIGLPSTLVVRTGEIGVAVSNRVTGTAATDITLRGVTTYKKVLNSMDIALGGATLNIQLGNEAQGAMIRAAGSIAGGLTITDLELLDGAGTVAAVGGVLGTTGGSIKVGTVNVRDTAGANLTLNASIDASANGLIVTMGGAINTDILLANVVLGGAAAAAGINPNTQSSIGDIEIVGLVTPGTQLAIYGH